MWIPGDPQPSEERDGSNAITKRFYAEGERIGGASYYYAKDHLGSIRELTDGSGVIQARYDYDPYGRRTKVSGSLDADFGFTGHYYHQPSGLYLALYRAYDPDLGRWISRDPIGFHGGDANLYRYVRNSPSNWQDPFGLKTCWNTMFVTAFNDKHGAYKKNLGPGDIAVADPRYTTADLNPKTGTVLPGHIKTGTAPVPYEPGTPFTIYRADGSIYTGSVADNDAGFAEPGPSLGYPNGVDPRRWLDIHTPSGNEDPEGDVTSMEVRDGCPCPAGWSEEGDIPIESNNIA